MADKSPRAAAPAQPILPGGQPITYQLYIHLRRPARLAPGRLGTRWLDGGWYVYTGSARRAINARVRRHVRARKRLRWHIDWLLARPQACVEWVALHRSPECAVNRATGGRIAVAGFGASDCRRACGSHLRYLGRERPSAVPGDAGVRWGRWRACRDGRAAAEEDLLDELFETIDERGQAAGLVPRARVHAEGRWHRAAHVWVFDSDGHVLVQQRSQDKDLNPGKWDVSVGEHLQPGEGYRDAALRGLHEELGLVVDALEPVGGEREVKLDRPELGVHDYELQQAFRVVNDAAVTSEPAEIAALERIAPAELRAWLAREPERFTPGFHRDVGDLGLLDTPP